MIEAGGVMFTQDADSDIAANLLERRWFASMTAARAKQAECDALLEVMAMVKASWRYSRAELLKLEAVRDALADAVTGRPAEGAAMRKLLSRSAERTSTAV
jgi:uncharacterized protein YicC (UPF0701 family)